MMTFKNSSRQIIELPSARLTHIALTSGLLRVEPALSAVGCITPWAAHTVGPAHLTNHVKALGVSDEILYIDLIVSRGQMNCNSIGSFEESHGTFRPAADRGYGGVISPVRSQLVLRRIVG